jgi:ketosteroid isomerase-like protein
MSEQTSDLIRRGYDAFNRGDVDAALAQMHPDVEWHVLDVFPDADVYHGHEGVRRFWELWTESFEDFRIEIEEIVERRDGVVVMGRVVGRIKGTGDELETPTYAQLWTVREGRASRVEMFPSKQQALEAGGAAR